MLPKEQLDQYVMMAQGDLDDQTLLMGIIKHNPEQFIIAEVLLLFWCCGDEESELFETIQKWISQFKADPYFKSDSNRYGYDDDDILGIKYLLSNDINNSKSVAYIPYNNYPETLKYIQQQLDNDLTHEQYGILYTYLKQIHLL